MSVWEAPLIFSWARFCFFDDGFILGLASVFFTEFESLVECQ